MPLRSAEPLRRIRIDRHSGSRCLQPERLDENMHQNNAKHIKTARFWGTSVFLGGHFCSKHFWRFFGSRLLKATPSFLVPSKTGNK